MNEPAPSQRIFQKYILVLSRAEIEDWVFSFRLNFGVSELNVIFNVDIQSPLVLYIQLTQIEFLIDLQLSRIRLLKIR